MKTPILILAIVAGIIGYAYAQSLSPQQIQDLQGQIADDTVTVAALNQQIQADTQQMANCNADIGITTTKMNQVQQRITDAQAVLAQNNQVNAS